MSHKQAIKFVRDQIKVLAEYHRLDNLANRYYRKQSQNRPKVKEEPKVPDHPSKGDLETRWFPITALHVVYNLLKGKENCHKFKNPHSWEAYETQKAASELEKYLVETFLVDEFSSELKEVYCAAS